jgi:hypothetical protein
MSVFIQTQIGPHAYKFEWYSVTENPLTVKEVPNYTQDFINAVGK